MSERESLLQDVDWTTSPGGRSNSSPLFNELADEIGRLLRGSAHDLIGGRTNDVGRLILAQLAHKHSLAPGHENHASVPAVIAAAGTIGWSVTAFLAGFLVCFIAFVRGWL